MFISIEHWLFNKTATPLSLWKITKGLFDQGNAIFSDFLF